VGEKEIGPVVLVGGGSQLFTILAHLRGRFGAENVVLADNPQEIVVQGIGLEYEAASCPAGPATILPVEAPAAETEPAPPPPVEAGWILKAADGGSIALAEGVTRVGRGEGNDWQLDALKISRFHAELRLAGGRLEAVDLGSTNGSFVNGGRLTPREPRELHAGDEIRFGSATFTCEKSS
jgi:hypothetical protein